MTRLAKVAGDAKDAAIADVSDRMTSIRDELAALASTVYEEGRDRGGRVLRAAGRDAGLLMDKGADAAGRARAHAGDLAVRTEDMVRARPAMALGIAVGLGLLIGMLSRRR